MTLYERLCSSAAAYPGRIAYRYFNKKCSYRRLVEQVDAAAARLAALGVKAGDRVGLCLVNSPEMLHLLYAVNRLGAVAVMCSPKASGRELREQLALTDCRILFFTAVSSSAVAELRDVRLIKVPVLGGLPANLFFGCLKRVLSQKRVGATPLKRVKKAALHDASTDDGDAVIIFSSGTSGECKAVVHTSRSMLASADYCMATEPYIADDADLLAILPCYHAFGLIVSVNMPLAIGICCRLMPFFHLPTIVRQMRRQMPAFMPAVPTVFERLCNDKRFCRLIESGKLDTRRFITGFVGGDTLSSDVINRWNALMRLGGGSGRLCNGYGMSECCPITLERCGLDGSVGQPFGGNEIRICEPGSFDEVSEGQSGEICVCSTGMMSRAFTRDSLIVPTEQGGRLWLRTGDVGHITNGRLCFDYRLRRLIKVSGHTVFAGNVESVAAEVDGVNEAYAVPVPHPSRGQGVFLFYVGAAAPSRVLDYCKNQLITYAVPVCAVQIDTAAVPHTELGKVAYGVLEKKAREYMQN